MNLYRSFGNLMETWVTDEDPCLDSEWLRNNAQDSHTPSSDMETNLRSESVDSGVETASCDTSFPATSRSVSTDYAEMDLFTPQEGLTPASTSQSPVFTSPVPSSSSPCLVPSRAAEGSAALHPKVEEALRRTDPKHLQHHPKPLTVHEVLNRRPRASILPKRHTSDLVRGQRRTVTPAVSARQMSQIYRQSLPLSCDRQRSEGLGAEQRKELSPGLSYLEEVCQMLEEIAKQQMHIRASQMEMDALWENEDTEAADTSQKDSAAAEEDLSSRQRLDIAESAEHSSSEPQQRKHFRQRSASDTTLAALHSRRLNVGCRGQHMSIDDLLEEVEENDEQQESTNETNKKWRFRLGALRREESAVSRTAGQQTQPSEKNSARRRLSQLFRRRRKTVPV